MIRLFLPLIVALPFFSEASEFDIREPTERNIVYGMDHGAALLMDRYEPKTPNGYALIFIMGTGFTAYGGYDDIPLKELDAALLNFGVFKDYYGQEGNFFGPALDAGFTVFSINHRLGPKSVWNDQLRDCQRAVQFIRSRAEAYSIGKEWIAAMGHSSGACMASLLALCDDEADENALDPVARESSKVQAAVLAAGIYDFNTQLEQRPNSSTILLSLTGKAVTYQPPRHAIFGYYKEMSPISFVTPDDAPIFLIHGTADDAVDILQSRSLAKKLTEHSVEHEFLELIGANHAEIGQHVDPPPGTQAVSWLLNQLPNKP